MSSLADLDVAITELATAITNLAGRLPTPIDTTPEITQVHDLTDQVNAMLPPPPGP